MFIQFSICFLQMRCSINDNNCTKIAMTPATSNSRPSRPTIVLLTELMGNGSVCGGQLFWPVNLFQFATQPLTLFVCLSRSLFLPPPPEPICAINYRAASKNARFFFLPRQLKCCFCCCPSGPKIKFVLQRISFIIRANVFKFTLFCLNITALLLLCWINLGKR